MSNVNRGVLVSELHWIKFIDTGKWNFYHYCDGVDEDLDIVFWGHIEKGRKSYFHSADCEYQNIHPEDLEWFPY